MEPTVIHLRFIVTLIELSCLFMNNVTMIDIMAKVIFSKKKVPNF